MARMVTVTSMRTPEDAVAFATLNEEWIRAYFDFEPKDRETIADPFGHYIEPGGDVLLARDEDGRAIGCVALEPTGDGVFELSKMAVAPDERGRGTGRRLMNAAIERARALGGTSLFLGSNHRLEAAVEPVRVRGLPPRGPRPHRPAALHARRRLHGAGALAIAGGGG